MDWTACNVSVLTRSWGDKTQPRLHRQRENYTPKLLRKTFHDISEIQRQHFALRAGCGAESSSL